MLSKFFILFYLSLLLTPQVFAQTKNSPKEPSSFVLYFHPLFEFEATKTQAYIKQLKSIISHNDSLSLEQILISRDEEKWCIKKTLPACVAVLYGRNRCIPKNKIPSRYCLKRSQTLSQSFFKEPVFNRIKWNKFSLKINQFCNQNANKLCQQLAALHNKYMKDYKKLIKSRRKFRKKNGL